MNAPSHPSTNTGYSADFVAGVLADALDHGCRTYAIAGLQGTGKSTLCAQVVSLAASRGVRAVALSIDDFYLSRAQRQALARSVHPLCATRGPPGSQDIPLACATIDALREGRPTALPQFDKIDDDRLPRAQWPLAQCADLIILEGWFLKVPPQADIELTDPVNALERDEDAQGIWRRWSNAALETDCPPLWSRLDRLLFLRGPGFDIVPRWRWQQEQTLQAAQPDRQAMTRQQVERFVQFFERVSGQALRTLPRLADRTITLDALRRPTADSGTGSGFVVARPQ